MTPYLTPQSLTALPPVLSELPLLFVANEVLNELLNERLKLDLIFSF